jgi:hypothetical protein
MQGQILMYCKNGEADTPEQAAHEGPGAISEKSAAVLPHSLLIDRLTNRENVVSAGRKALYTICLYMNFFIGILRVAVSLGILFLAFPMTDRTCLGRTAW